MSFAINILALLLVLGLCWFAMVWLTRRFHGHGSERAGDEIDYHRDIMTGLPMPARPGSDCTECKGVGATQHRGKLMPCRMCEGTGTRQFS